MFCWEPYTLQWWITGFNQEFNNPIVEDMVVIGVIDFGMDKDMNTLDEYINYKVESKKKADKLIEYINVENVDGIAKLFNETSQNTGELKRQIRLFLFYLI